MQLLYEKIRYHDDPGKETKYPKSRYQENPEKQIEYRGKNTQKILKYKQNVKEKYQEKKKKM